MIELTVQNAGLGQVGDPTVDNDARIQHVWPNSLDFLGEFHVGNDEAKVIFRLQQHADADVTQRNRQQQFNDRKIGPLLQVLAKQERFEHHAQRIGEEQPDQDAEIDAGDDVKPLLGKQDVTEDQCQGRQDDRREEQIRVRTHEPFKGGGLHHRYGHSRRCQDKDATQDPKTHSFTQEVD